jgi:hypothetical protein
MTERVNRLKGEDSGPSAMLAIRCSNRPFPGLVLGRIFIKEKLKKIDIVVQEDRVSGYPDPSSFPPPTTGPLIQSQLDDLPVSLRQLSLKSKCFCPNTGTANKRLTTNTARADIVGYFTSIASFSSLSTRIRPQFSQTMIFLRWRISL